MCTYRTLTSQVTGSGLSESGWFGLRQAVVYYDHPQDAPVEHALCIDFRDGGAGATQRVAVELDPASARRLAAAIVSALDGEETPPGSPAQRASL